MNNKQNNQKMTLATIQNKLQNWQSDSALVHEGEAVKLLRTIDAMKKAGSEAELMQLQTIEAEIMMMLVTARVKRLSETDHLTGKWIERVLEIDPANKKAKYFRAKSILSDMLNIVEPLEFPPLRETDNRPLKRNAALEHIQISRSLLEQEEHYENLLDNGYHAAEAVGDHDLKELYGVLHEDFTLLLDQTARLIRASEQYLESLSGVFYTSNFLEEMKDAVKEMRVIRQKWYELIQASEDTDHDERSCLHELDNMIGLNSVKARVHRLYHFLNYQKRRKELGFSLKDEVSLNMILTGNPGTGKTTLARLLAKVYYELGVLPRNEVVEADRSQLVGAYVGQTEENVMNMVKEAVGGVLFIDEAYSLKRDGQAGNDYGQTAVDTLVSAMTSGEYAGKFAVILAGYPEEMRQFLWSNPGLRSRFPESNHITLPDYTTTELLEIAEKVAMDNDYTFTDDALLEFEKRIEKERVDESFGNARTVKNLVLDAIFKKGARLSGETDDIVDFTMIEREDVELEEEQTEHLSGLKELDVLVGLTNVKEEVRTLYSFIKVQQMRREQGLPVVPVQLHSVFTGNPGTGKTTVAKIYASILRETGLLKRGHLVIASRSDLVAGYTGQTAIKTKKKIREALGGVLFIDEAYSLLSQAQSDFGKEAVDTLVDEMTKHNENLVVILSGYPKEMEHLLQSNPGLKSRFKKFYSFKDYNTNELIEMAARYSEKYGYQLTTEARDYFLEFIDTHPVTGNGRYVSNVMDEAIQEQANRLLQDEFIEDKASLMQVTKSDLEAALHKNK